MIRRLRLHPAVIALASAHFITDAYGNMYAALLPAILPRLQISLAVAGTLTMLLQFAGSVMQLAFGHLADRWRPRLLMAVGPLVSVLVLSTVGLAPSVPVLALTLVIGGLGSAAFHPPAAAVVHRVSTGRQGFAMSFHITAGSIGFSLAPMLFAPFIDHYGLRATPYLALPGLLALAVVLRNVPSAQVLRPGGQEIGLKALRPYARNLAYLYAIVVLRTLTSLSFATFTPVMLTRRGWSLTDADQAISVYLFATAIGGFFGGPLADRFGARRIIIVSLLLAVPFLATAPFLTGAWFVIVLSIGGLFLQSTLPVNVTFAHALAPVSAATVSALMMGFAWGVGGLTAPLVGLVADQVGITATLVALAFVPLASAACAVPLPPRTLHEKTFPLPDVGHAETLP